MTKFGCLLGIPYIICLCHTINLAALATMFEKEESQHQLNAIQESSDTEDEDDILKNCQAKAGIGMPLKHISDVKTRWNSLVKSSSRFLML
jgi:hypothetical protein